MLEIDFSWFAPYAIAIVFGWGIAVLFCATGFFFWLGAELWYCGLIAWRDRFRLTWQSTQIWREFKEFYKQKEGDRP